MSKTTILYKDIAPGADEDAAVSTTAAVQYSDISALPFGSDDKAYITSELNRWGLSGEFESIDRVSFWSSVLSDENGVFSEQPVITIDFDEQYSSVGIFISFDPAGGEYCSEINIKWYQGDTLKQDLDFYPDSPSYFCNQRVEAYDRIIITLKKTSFPVRRAKVNQIIFGIYRQFEMNEIRAASITNETSISALELPISTMDWDIDSKTDIEFMFQLKQPVEVRNDNHLIGVYYVDGSTRHGVSYYSVDCYDAYGVLDEYPFSGGVYSGKSAKAIVSEIVGDDFTVTYAENVQDTNLTGVIQACTKREALQQVFFAWGVLTATDGDSGIKIFTESNTAKVIGKDQTYTGVSVETSAIVTEVRVTAHTYAQDENGAVEINGVKYSDTGTVYTVKNPNVTATDKQNVVEVTDATLVSTGIGHSVAQRVYDYYLRRNTHNGKIVWKGEHLGDYLTLPNNWNGTNTGHVSKMDITLSNTVAANVTSIGV